ncbi:helix-turn-helix transcriptional regulator [Sorangium sp. So ce295]|uniref:helix-turn-helix transcriptional regulator n=1 Tax=Sorangium sp. So ce295 TaxID=3133295 RepID=UPI003F61DE94
MELTHVATPPESMLERAVRTGPVDLRTAVTRGEEHAGERVVAGLLRQILCESSSLSERDCVAAVGVVLEAIGMCGRAPELPQARVERALADIEVRLGDPTLQPADIARAQGVSRRYLDGVMAEQLGCSLAAHIRRRRLERAASELSLRPLEAVSEVAARWGFRDTSHFTRLFRGHFATTPAAYRRAARDHTSTRTCGGGGRTAGAASLARGSSAAE